MAYRGDCAAVLQYSREKGDTQRTGRQIRTHDIVEKSEENHERNEACTEYPVAESVQVRCHSRSPADRSLKYSNTEKYYLVIADENGLQVQREEFQIDIAFATEEFDFF